MRALKVESDFGSQGCRRLVAFRSAEAAFRGAKGDDGRRVGLVPALGAGASIASYFLANFSASSSCLIA